MILSDEEEENATLAEPMTLEGAKQLAKTSGSTPTHVSSNLTPPLNSSLQVTSPPSPLLASPTPPPSYNHLSPLAGHLHHLPLNHGSRSILYPLASPPPHSPAGSLHQLSSPHHLSSPFTSPSHISSIHHPNHSLWVPSPAVGQVEVSDDESNLPSTVDIQAIRESPSPELTSDKLMTINENWDSLDQSGFSANPDIENDSCENEDSEDEDLSDSDLSDSSVSIHSHSSHKSLLSSSNKFSPHVVSGETMLTSLELTSTGDKSDSCDSKSDSDSQDSDSNSSDCSSSSDSESRSSADEDRNITDKILTKSLPRRKPQLTACNSTFANRSNYSSLIAKGRLLCDAKASSSLHNTNEDKHCEKDVTDLADSLTDNSKSFTERLDSCTDGIEGSLNVSCNDVSDIPNPLACESLFRSSTSISKSMHLDKCTLNVHENKLNCLSKSTSKLGEYSRLAESSAKKVCDLTISSNQVDKISNLDSCANLHVKDIKLSETEKSKTTYSKPSLDKSIYGEFSDSDSKEVTSMLSEAELERRRLEKKKELEKEFDRLLKSSTILNKQSESVKGNADKTVDKGSKTSVSPSTAEKCQKEEIVSSESHTKSVLSSTISDEKPSVKSSSKEDFVEKQNSEPYQIHSVNRSYMRFKDESKRNDLNNKCKKMGYSHSVENLISDIKSKPPISCHKANSFLNHCQSDSLRKHEDKLATGGSKNKVNSSSISRNAEATGKNSHANNHSLKSPSIKLSQNVSSQKTKECLSKRNECTKLGENSQSNAMDQSSPPHPCSWAQPTIADTVKFRERRKSFEKESSLSGSEKEKERGKKAQSSYSRSERRARRKRGLIEEFETSSSETSDELNEKIDVDREQTQTFSVTGNHFNQDRLSLKIAAMKMAKFGKTGLREVTTGVLPTRSDFLHFSEERTNHQLKKSISHKNQNPSLSSLSPKTSSITPKTSNLSPRKSSFSPKTSNLSPKASSLALKASNLPPKTVASTHPFNSHREPHQYKVKTAAERKTYFDDLPACGSWCSTAAAMKSRRKREAKQDIRVMATSLYQPSEHSAKAIHGSSHSSRALHHNTTKEPGLSRDNNLTRESLQPEDRDEITKIAQSLSQISPEPISQSLQVLDQDDLAAILPDVNSGSHQQEAPSSGVSFDSFADDAESNAQCSGSDTELDSSRIKNSQDEDILSRVHPENAFPSIPEKGGKALGKSEELSDKKTDSVIVASQNRSRYESQKGSHQKAKEPHCKIDKKRGSDRPEQLSIEEETRNHSPQIPEMDGYASLDCSASNVSPDSGIQSVSGSPLHPVGSPNHPSPFYSSSLMTHASASCVNSSSENIVDPISDFPSGGSCPRLHPRPYSPVMPSQDSPPPPTLLPAVTPPHMMSSPRYNYEEGAESPPMPSLKCQIDPPPWREPPLSLTDSMDIADHGHPCTKEYGEEVSVKDSDKSVSLDQTEEGTESQEDCESLAVVTKPKRQRGRPKGSKNKKKDHVQAFIPVVEKRQVKSFILEPSNMTERLRDSGGSTPTVPEVDYSALKHNWRCGAPQDVDEFSSIVKTSKKGPGRPKKIDVPSAITSSAGTNYADDTKRRREGKRSVGRPRKHSSSQHLRGKNELLNKEHTTRKCSNEKLVHRMVNEKVRNSEKSDKLSVSSLPKEGVDSDLKIAVLGVDPESISKRNERRKLAKYAREILMEKRKKRGRRKELPAIFGKVYGSNNTNRKSCVGSLPPSHKKKKRKHKKIHRSKRKNIIDPVFLSEVEELVTELQMCMISKNLVATYKQSVDILPLAFRVRKILQSSGGTKRKRGVEKIRNSDKESSNEAESGKEKIHSGKRKKKCQDTPKQGKERSESNEQRLPLKKRHRHISTAVPLSPDACLGSSEKGEKDLNLSSTTQHQDDEETAIEGSLEEKSSSEAMAVEADSLEEKQPCKPPLQVNHHRMQKTDTKISKSISESKSGVKPVVSTSDSARFKGNIDLINLDSTSESGLQTSESESFLESRKNEEQTSYDAKDTTDESFSIPTTAKEESPPILVDDTTGLPISGDTLSITTMLKKDSSLLHTLPTTTPKKRHRLESELSGSPSAQNTVDTTSPLSCDVVSTNLVTTQSSTLPITEVKNRANFSALNVKQERDIQLKVSGLRDKVSKSAHSRNSDRDTNTIVKGSESVLPADEAVIKGEIDSLHEADKLVKTCDDVIGSESDGMASEHEPLNESDRELASSTATGKPSLKSRLRSPRRQARKKCNPKKRSLSPQNNAFSNVTILSTPSKTVVSISSPPLAIKKKAKRRKTNKTGFPTIKKKKKKPIVVGNNISLEPRTNEGHNVASNNTDSIDCDALTNALPVDKCEDVEGLNSKSRGRPKKSVPKKVSKDQLRDKCLSINNNSKKFNGQLGKHDDDRKTVDSTMLSNGKASLCDALEGVSSRTRNKRDFSEENVSKRNSALKKSRRMLEDEFEDSDSNVPMSDCTTSSEAASGDESARTGSRVPKKIPRWRRKFIAAGLFSNYYKQDVIPRRNSDASTGKNKITFESAEERTHKLLPPPCYCRKWLRERLIDFKLPYDLWWLHSNKMLPGRDVIASWNYRKVKSNVYYDVKPNHSFEAQACNCKRPLKQDEKGCGDDCINRMMFIECTSQTCPIADLCLNQRIQRHEIQTNLQRFMTDAKGWGIKATEKVKSGSFILEYVGEVVSEKEFKYRMQTRYVTDTHHYCLNLDRGMVIDGHRIGGDCRFVNHSCEPNCEMQKWFVNGQYRMALFALKDIDKGEELTYDYNFSLFNPAEGQMCKCGSVRCRGVIGGRSQRLNSSSDLETSRRRTAVLRPSKRELCKKRKRGNSTDTEPAGNLPRSVLSSKPLSHQQRLYILTHRCFLLRNLEKVRLAREKLNKDSESVCKLPEVSEGLEEPTNKIEKFLTHFTALNTARSVKTRRLAQAEDDPEMTRVAKLAQIFKDIFDKLVASRDESDSPLAAPFMSLPSKKKSPSYYTRVGQPIDLSTIERNILTGHYITVESFHDDVMKIFSNNLRFYGRNSEIGRKATGLRKVYSECKLQFKPFLEEVLGEDQLPLAFANCSLNEEYEDEDVIRCICNLYQDEGIMIQCEQCLVWQHCDCMGISEETSPEHYLCEECSPRYVSPEVPMTPQPTDIPLDHKHFITLLRDNLQIKQGDSVYILRDRPPQKPGERRLPAYKLCKDVKTRDLLIFKVENLWIDGNGDKFAFGHHYLRPQETFHEPWRKFFPNEVIRSPHCEILPLDMIVNHCWVMDLNSYCRGRPILATEEHVYICEYRVDKIARIFSKISRPKYPICTKPYAFISFSTKLKPQRTYTPHEVTVNGRARIRAAASDKNEKSDKPKGSAVRPEVSQDTQSQCIPEISNPSLPPSCRSRSNSSGSRSHCSASRSRERAASSLSCHSSSSSANAKTVVCEKGRKFSQGERKRVRVNDLSSKLLKTLASKGAPVDLSFLFLDSGRRKRRKPTSFGS